MIVGIGLIVILIIQATSSYFRVLLFTNVSEKGMADIRKALYNKLITQPISFFDQLPRAIHQLIACFRGFLMFLGGM